MLRRTQSIVLKDENEQENELESSAPAETRLRSVRREPPVAAASEPPPVDASRRPEPPPFVERRSNSDRRGMDALRAEALRAVISQVEDRNFGGLRHRVGWSAGIKPKQIALFAVAIAAGGLAAFLAFTQGPDAPAPVAAEPIVEVVAAPTTQVLVARMDVGAGQRLTEAALGWEEWPLSAVHPHYITIDATPDAPAEVGGAVARSGILSGEPIRAEKLVEASGSFLAAVLGGGNRAVSVIVGAESASGGFVAPEDRVDVLLTRTAELGQDSRTILQNVRVLAINARLGETDAAAPADEAVFTGTAIATLELDRTQAEVITAASTMGQLTLVLRSSADTAEPVTADQRASNQIIRLTSPFWAK